MFLKRVSVWDIIWAKTACLARLLAKLPNDVLSFVGVTYGMNWRRC